MSRDKPKGGMRQKAKSRHADVREDKKLIREMVKKKDLKY
jgi:hypothetical protein